MRGKVLRRNLTRDCPPLTTAAILARNTLFYGALMLKRITKVGNSHGLVFDAALRELSGLQAGDQVNVTVHEGGTIVLTPIRKAPSQNEVTEVIRKTVKDYRKTLKRLA